LVPQLAIRFLDELFGKNSELVNRVASGYDKAHGNYGGSTGGVGYGFPSTISVTRSLLDRPLRAAFAFCRTLCASTRTSEQALRTQNQAGDTARPAAITGSWDGFILASLGLRDGIQVNFAPDDNNGSDTLYCSSWGETKCRLATLDSTESQ